MRFSMEVANDGEAYNIIDTQSDQSHDGDGARELICRVYDPQWARQIRSLLERDHTLYD